MLTISDHYLKPNSLGKEGVDHINVSYCSSSRLGRLLDPNYAKVVHLPEYGKFRSAVSLYYWIKTGRKDDRLRVLTRNKLIRYITDNKLYINKSQEPTNDIIDRVTMIKLENYPDLLEQFISLPRTTIFTSYIINKNTGLRVVTSYAKPILNTVKRLHNRLSMV